MSRPVEGRPLLLVLAAVTTLLLAVNVVLKVLADPGRNLGPWLVAFDVNRENNVPTVWNAALLLGVAAAAVLVASLVRSGASWCVLALAATAMGFDEMLRVHEQLRSLGVVLQEELGLDLPTYAAVLPLAVVGTALLVAVVPWSKRLPGDVRRRLVLGVGLFLCGAVGAEAVSGWINLTYGTSRAYTVVTTAEEALEMGGCLVVLAGVLRMLRTVPLDDRTALVARAPEHVSTAPEEIS